LLIGTALASPNISYDTLESLIQKGVNAFSSGNYPASSEAFQSAFDTYRHEPEWEESRLSEKILPLSGFASLKAGLYDRSIMALALFLEEESYAYSQEIFARYALVLSYQKNGDIASAIAECNTLEESAHSHSLKSLAALRRAQLLLDSGKESEGAKLLIEIAQSEGAQRVRQQARLIAIRKSLDDK